MFTNEELQIIKYGRENGRTAAQVVDSIANYRASLSPVEQEQKKKGFFSGAGSSLKDSYTKIKAEMFGTGEYADSIAPVRGVQVAGTLATSLPKALISGIAGITPYPIKAGLNKYVANPIGRAFTSVTDLIGSNESLQKFVMENPEATKIIEETAKVTGALSETAGGLLATQGMINTASGAAGLAKTGATKVLDTASRGVNMAKTGVTKTGDFLRGAKDAVKPLWQEAKTLPNKARVNLAQSRATEATIRSLKPAGQTAVRSGVELADVKALYNLPKTITSKLKPLINTVKKFSSGKSTTNPLEIVGKPIMGAFKKAQVKASSIGIKLGKVSDTLGNVSSKQVFPKVFAQLKKVQGLQGLKVNSKGILDFSNTNLASTLSKADRIAIQKIFTEAIKSGTGKSKHLYRQELFNILGGKKSGLSGLSGTQENAFNAVRKGLSDALDDINPTYRALNTKYAQAISPVERLKKMLKASGLDDDLADMKAGTFARRLTSNSVSKAELKQILRDLDKVIGTASKSGLSAEKLQDFYNILDKYYDIAGRTSFQGQITSGVSKAVGGKGGISRAIDMIEGQVGKLVGETDIVKQRALEEVLKEIFGNI